MLSFFYEILYRPLFNALIFLYNVFPVHDIGVAIILLTILIRIILFPLFYKSAKSQTILQKLVPKIKEIQETHKQDKEKQARVLMDLYREHKVSPFTGILFIIIQLPILIALYQVFLKGINADGLSALYSFIAKPDYLNSYFLGFVDLSQKNIVIAVAAAAFQYFQGKLLMPPANSSDKNLGLNISKQMLYLGPILTVAFLWALPSAVGLYWLTISVISVIQQLIINRVVKNNGVGNSKK